jgi:benzoyl-CoA reductase subunit A
MKCYCGIDLGSTTSKAVILDDRGRILGRGITNSRSNYEVACQVALTEARNNARFALLDERLAEQGLGESAREALLDRLGRAFRMQQYLEQLGSLRTEMDALLADDAHGAPVAAAVDQSLSRMDGEAAELFAAGARRKSDFFRDLAGSRYLALSEEHSRERGLPFDELVGLFDKAILRVENTPEERGFETLLGDAIDSLEAGDRPAELVAAVEVVRAVPMEHRATVGTGYGRQTLPFEKRQIRSEILCHGLGAHAMFPGTRTVLDIGGQDTKAIQVDESGIVTSFQMNDRCAAGCGRYLGYIADEMNLGLHELGPLAQQSERPVRINSTCTVFAGAELRERLSLGERREDILAGLHRSIILRALSLLARSGGVQEQFTFTGGVARNPAAVETLHRLIGENYGEITLNISPDSIYTGALGAALFALRDAESLGTPDPALAETIR